MSKLVRDNVPDVIRASGREIEVTHVSGDMLKQALKDKLVEEALELKDTDNVEEELADVLEVVDAIVESYGIDYSKLETLKNEKHDRLGGFSCGHYMITKE